MAPEPEQLHNPEPERSGPIVAIVGVGAVGRKIAEGLEERDFPIGHIVFFASERSAGQTVEFRGEVHEVRELTMNNIRGFDLAFLAATTEVSLEWAERFTEDDCLVIDITSAHRMTAPLIVPEVNPEALGGVRPPVNRRS